MKIYAAVSSRSSTNSGLPIALRAGFRNVLISYEAGRENVLAVIFKCRAKGVGVFVDSGAFSAHTRGHRVDLDGYIRMCLAVAPLVDAVACLDVIGDAVATARNQATMEAAGLAPLATAHFGMDPKEVADRFARTRCGALGGMALKTRTARPMRQGWLDKVFDALVASSSWPIRVHGYGMTDNVLVERYPWYSVDSTTWAMTSWFGNELEREGRFLVQRRSILIPGKGSASDVARVNRSAPRMVDYAEYCTRLWEKRGVKWDS